MVGSHRLNGENIDAFADARERYIVVAINGCVIQQPGDIDWQITAQNGALHRGRFAVVQWLLAEIKGSDLGGDLSKTTRCKGICKFKVGEST